MHGTMFLVDFSGALLGVCSKERNGWVFLPAVASHRSERTTHPSPTSSIPSWAFKLAGDLLTDEEWRHRKVRR